MSERRLPLNFPLYEGGYNGSIPDEQYFIILFDTIPSAYSTKHFYSKDIINHFKKIGFIEDCKVLIPRRYSDRVFESLLINHDKHIMINVQTNFSRDSELLTCKILYDLKHGEIEAQINLKEFKKYCKKLSNSRIHLVRSDMGHLDTEEYELPSPVIDLELNYGKGFTKIHEIIVKRLNTDRDKGIILLYGDTGTGKTTYLKYLTKQIREKDILFIPPSMAEIISEPQIIPFLMDNRNSILLIEDAEKVISDREGRGSMAGVSNILNLTDGILGDCLNIQVIATFNKSKEKIDSALLRKGRLICEHRFRALDVNESNILLKYLGKNSVAEKAMTLADIYNIDVEEVKVSSDPKKIGYNAS